MPWSGKCIFHFQQSISITASAAKEAERDAGFVRRLCAQYMGFPFSLYSYDVPKMAEEQGLSEEKPASCTAQGILSGDGRGSRKRSSWRTIRDDMASAVISAAGGMDLAGSGLNLVHALPFKRNPRMAEGTFSVLCTDSTNLSHDYARNGVPGYSSGTYAGD